MRIITKHRRNNSANCLQHSHTPPSLLRPWIRFARSTTAAGLKGQRPAMKTSNQTKHWNMHTRHWNNILWRNRKDSDETRIWTDLMLRQVARSCQSATHACYFNNYARVPLSVLIDSCCKWGRGQLCFTVKAAFCYQPCWRYVAVERTFMLYGFTLHGHALLCYCSRVGLGSLRVTSISTEMQCTLTGQPWRNSSAASHKIKPVIARSAPVHLRCATRNMYTVMVCGIHTVTYRGVSYSYSDSEQSGMCSQRHPAASHAHTSHTHVKRTNRLRFQPQADQSISSQPWNTDLRSSCWSSRPGSNGTLTSSKGQCAASGHISNNSQVSQYLTSSSDVKFGKPYVSGRRS